MPTMTSRQLQTSGNSSITTTCHLRISDNLSTSTPCQLRLSGHLSLLTPGHSCLSDMLSHSDNVSTPTPESSNIWLNPAPGTIPPTSPLRELSSSEVLSTEIVISIQSDLHPKLRRRRIREGAAHKLKPIVLLRPNSLVQKSASATLHLITLA